MITFLEEDGKTLIIEEGHSFTFVDQSSRVIREGEFSKLDVT